MHVGVCRITLRLAEGNSLKDKRRVVRSLVERLRHQFNVAVAEVDSQDSWRTAVLGIAVVSNESAHADQQVARVVAHIENTRLDAELVDSQTEIIAI
ncbi:MAG TPA: DUF503 domain-containing protein [Chloroflexota bacterium]|nr:DUF503 domain-containing protein [Chloroflexota bacterium]